MGDFCCHDRLCTLPSMDQYLTRKPAMPIRSILIAILSVVLLSGPHCRGTTGPSRKHKSTASSVLTPSAPSGTSTTVSTVAGQGADWFPGSHSTGVSFSDVLLDKYINPRRDDKGLPRLKWHDGLAAVSLMHATDMANRNYLSLVSPEGISIYQRLVSSNPKIDFTSADAFVMNTPGNSLQLFNSLLANPAGRSVIDNPATTHFGGWNLITPARKGAVIFGQNVTP